MDTREGRPQFVDSVPQVIGDRPPQRVPFRLQPGEIYARHLAFALRDNLANQHPSVRQFANVCQTRPIRRRDGMEPQLDTDAHR